MDPLFSIWWQEYVLFHQSEGEMFDCDPDEPPEHEWDWPRNPVADSAAEVSTNAERLRTGQASPSEIAHENGESWEERLRKLSKDYGKTVDEVREAIFTVTFAPKSGGQLQPGAGPQSEGFPNGFPKKPPAAGDAESGDAAEVKKLAAMVATMSEGILAMQQTLRGIVGQAFQPDTK
ncbi:MAG: hypothetical protein NTY19_40110 [Planctomycetota bacterium]|nr:hypothetical protein [Planctomycetota bacterium]